MKRISDIGLKKLKEFEGLRKEAYYDAAGVPTIGYGHTKGVRMGDVISEYWAEMFLKAVSFAFNLGFYKLKTSTLLKTIQEGGSMRAIKKEFKRWVYAGGKKLRGLERRREWEARRFFEPDEMEPMKRRDWSDFHKEN